MKKLKTENLGDFNASDEQAEALTGESAEALSNDPPTGGAGGGFAAFGDPPTGGAGGGKNSESEGSDS